MKSFNSSNVFWLFLFFALIYSAQVLPRLNSDSLTNDEPTEITNGYYYLTQGDVSTPHLHPPLASALNALPLLALKLKTLPYSGNVMDRAHSFIFDWNHDQISMITVLCRSVSWLFGLFSGFLLFWITRSNPFLCFAALFLWAFNPTFLALAGVAKIEIVPSFFFFLAVWFFSEGLKKSNQLRSFWSGIITALAVTSKYYGLVLIPVFAILDGIHTITGQNPSRWAEMKKRWVWGFLGFLIWCALLYVPALVFSSHGFGGFLSPFEKLTEDFVFAQHPFPVYFLGRSGLENHWYYFPIAFLLKEPLPFLFLLVLTVGLVYLKKIPLSLWQWLPVVVFGFSILPATNLGIRYLLPVYPFLFLIAAQGLVWLWQEGKRKAFFHWVLGGLIFWQAASVLFSFPHALSYFNELVPSDQKLYYLADSNLDWGQDSKRLAEESQKKNWGKVKLAYLGGVDPQIYGLDWEPFQPEDLVKPQPGWVYVINASFYQLAPVTYPPTRAIAESWISRTAPTGKVADSWYYFEIPGQKSLEKPSKWLPSVPFLQYHGFCAYPLNSRQ